MKRNHPTTEKPFKRGDVREDGYVFFAYTKIVKSDGFFKEIWLNPEASEKARQKDRSIKKAKYQRKSNRNSPGFHELSPLVKAAIHQIERLNEEQKAYGDLTVELVAEELVGYELTSEEWDVVLDKTKPHQFDLKEAIRISLTA